MDPRMISPNADSGRRQRTCEPVARSETSSFVTYVIHMFLRLAKASSVSRVPKNDPKGYQGCLRAAEGSPKTPKACHKDKVYL